MKSQWMARIAICVGLGALLLGMPTMAGATSGAAGHGGPSGAAVEEASPHVASGSDAAKTWKIKSMKPNPVTAIANGASSTVTVTYSGKTRGHLTIHVEPTASCTTSFYTCSGGKIVTSGNPVTFSMSCEFSGDMSDLPYTGTWKVWLTGKKKAVTPKVAEKFTCDPSS